MPLIAANLMNMLFNAADVAVVGKFVGDVSQAAVTSSSPLVSLLVGGLSVSDWKWVIRQAVLDAEGAVVTAETALCYGNFIQTVIDFLIVALTIFTVLRVFTKLQIKREKK